MPKILVRNEPELYAEVMPRVRKAMEYVAERILNENEDLVTKLFYGQYSPTVYGRSMDFLDAWDFDPIEQHGHSVEAEFGYNASMVHSDPENYVHGSPYSGSIAGALADILYDGVWGSLFGEGPWQRTSNAFDMLVQHLDKGKFDKWMKAGMKQAGLYVV